MAATTLSDATGVGTTPTINQVTVDTTADVIVVANPNRANLLIHNADASETLYVGGSDVTTSNGFPIPAGSSRYVDKPLGASATWYGVVGTGSITVAYHGA